MSTALIFGLGLVVTAITSAAVILVGISEAADPSHSRPEDLAGWERSLVGRGVRQKPRTMSEAGKCDRRPRARQFAEQPACKTSQTRHPPMTAADS